MKRLVLVDGNALLHRAYHATPPLTTSKGELVNAVYGFTSMLLRSIEELKPDYIAVAWDKKDPTFRHQAYTQYKATRRPMEDGLSGQYQRVFEIVDALNIPEFSLSGYEADDLIGTLARQAEKEKNLEIIVVTGDKDIMQLIDKHIKVLMPKKTLSDIGLYGEEEFAARFGFEPIKLIDYKGLAGDASDNIPGVPGIGEVSATKLIQRFGSVENIYRPENLQTLPERMQKLLAEGAESAVMSKQLATIEVQAPIRLDLSACTVHDFDRERVRNLFEEVEFRSLIVRIPGLEEARGVRQEAVVTDTENSEVVEPSAFRLPPPASVTTDLDLAVTPILQKMSQAGVLVDVLFLEGLSVDLKARLVDIEKEIYSLIGHEINLNSPKQLSVVLFDELNLPVFRKTKTGRSTDEETLQQLQSAHPAIPLILEYRQLFKLLSTYVDALPKYVGEDGRVHSTFNVEGAATGRLSSQDPNLQNIPVKGERGGELRKAFIAPKGKVLFAADYSQVELRILAHVTDDPALKKAFQEGLDVHAATAAKIFKVPLEQVTKQQRTIGKTINFATLYGQGPHALSRQLGIEYGSAKEYIEEYFAQFPKVKEWVAKVLIEGREKGYVETIWGRKRYMPELNSQNHMLRAAGERAAANHPIQGCLPWETKILTSKGYIPIGELYETKKRPPTVWDGTAWKSYEVLDRGKAQLAQIKFSNGQLFKCDTRHKVLTVNEDGYQWTEFAQLRAGMKVCFSMPMVREFSCKSFRFKHMPKVHNGIALNITADEDLWYWLGYYIGDGYISKQWNRAWVYQLSYYFGEHEIIKKEKCIEFFTKLGLNPKQRKMTHRPHKKVSTRYEVTISSQGIGKLFEVLGLFMGKTAHTKSLPPRIFNETLENRTAFVKGIMDSDGNNGVKEKNSPNIHLCQREILQEIQILLRTLGIESKIRGPYIYKDKVSYRLDIHRNSLGHVLKSKELSYYNRSIKNLAPRFVIQEAVMLGGHLDKSSFYTLSDATLYSRWKKGGSSSLYHFQTWLKRNNISLQQPIYDYNEIVEIIKLDRFETTYTLSVPVSHRFDSEGVISKNTSADMIKKAMVEIDEALGGRQKAVGNIAAGNNQDNHGLKPSACHLILQVHDELLFECDPDSVAETAKMVKEKMEQAIELSVPVIVDLKVGPNWGEMEKLILK